MDPEKKSLNFIFPTKYVIPKSLKFCQMVVSPLLFVSFPGCKTVGVFFQNVEIPGLPGDPMNKKQDEWEWRRSPSILSRCDV